MDLPPGGGLERGTEGEEKREEGDWAALIRSRKKLDRDRGISELRAALESGKLPTQRRESLERELLGLVSSLGVAWEEKHGGLMAVRLLVQKGTASSEFCERLQREIPQLLEHEEARVRLSAGE